MKNQKTGFITFFVLGLVIISLSCATQSNQENNMNISSKQAAETVDKLVSRFGEAQRAGIEQGVKQAARFWQKSDGTPEAFTEFCLANYIADPEKRRQTFLRLENGFEQIWGHFSELGRDLRWNLEIETGPILPVDYLLGEFNPAAHTMDDLFKTKIAFVVLLNFPVNTLDERLKLGPKWSREQWAEDRLVKTFQARVPGDVAQKQNLAYLAADNYIAEYNIMMDHVLTKDGQRLFPEGLKLITHWGLRDELKAHYADPLGLPKQQMIHKIMERIIHQDIPRQVINNPKVDWIVETNEVKSAEKTIAAQPENDVRYQRWLDVFHAEKAADPYYPNMPTMMQRRFESGREISEARIEALFTELLSSPVIKDIANLIQTRLGRPLEPFDIWYDGFKARGSIQESELDKIIGRKYPTVASFQSALQPILRKLGFTPETAQFLASKIQVDPSRGAGHASEGGRRSDKAHLRTRIPESGMNYKGYNIAIHEFGHNVEQVFSLNRMDHYLLRGVPNNAFTEAFAFLFQSRDLSLLGVEKANSSKEYLKVLDQIWSTYEIAGVSLVDMAVWRWLYENPNATAAQMKEAVIQTAINVWNQFYAPVFGIKDSPLLAIYSHMIAYGLYLPDYPLGHIIDFQIESYMQGKNLAAEMERMCRLGSITPDYWMQQAVGAPISVKPMLEAAEAALKKIK